MEVMKKLAGGRVATAVLRPFSLLLLVPLVICVLFVRLSLLPFLQLPHTCPPPHLPYAFTNTHTDERRLHPPTLTRPPNDLWLGVLEQQQQQQWGWWVWMDSWMDGWMDGRKEGRRKDEGRWVWLSVRAGCHRCRMRLLRSPSLSWPYVCCLCVPRHDFPCSPSLQLTHTHAHSPTHSQPPTQETPARLSTLPHTLPSKHLR